MRLHKVAVPREASDEANVELTSPRQACGAKGHITANGSAATMPDEGGPALRPSTAQLRFEGGVCVDPLDPRSATDHHHGSHVTAVRDGRPGTKSAWSTALRSTG